MADEVVVETTEQAVEQGAGDAQANVGEMPADGNEVEQLRAALKRANAEAAERRHKLTQYEEAERKRAEAEMSEMDKANKRLAEAQARADELENRMRGMMVRHVVERTATALRFHDPQDAFALADLTNVQVDEDGNVDAKGIESALKALAKAKPHLVRSEQLVDVNAQARNNGAPALSDNEAQRLAAIYGVRPESIKQAVRR